MRIGQIEWIEGSTQGRLSLEIVLVEHERQVVTLLETDAVLPREDATGGDTGTHDEFACRVDSFHHAGFPFVEDDQWMQVAVSGVEDVEDQEIVVGHDPIDLIEDLG